MDMSSGSSSSSCEVSMLWNWNTIGACFISSSWHIKNSGMMAATCIGTIFLVVLVEFSRRLGKEFDGFLLRQFHRQAAARRPTSAPECAREQGSREQVVMRASALQQLIRAVLHAITFGGAYIIMLLAMYFNGFIIICIFIGAGLGKFFCDWLVVRIDVGPLDEGATKVRGIEETTVCCG